MASASVFHLLTNPPVADYPDASTIISASTPEIGRLTTQLLDPAVAPAGAAQTLATLNFAALGNGTIVPNVTLSNASVANPTVITATAHGYMNNDVVYIAGTSTTPSIAGLQQISNVTANTFTVPVNVTVGGAQTGTVHRMPRFVYGRWITRQLPAQTINAGNWTLSAVQRNSGTAAINTSTASPYVNSIWGFCVAQWRAGTGVVARFLDNPDAGTGQSTTTNYDRAQQTTVAGVQLTLTANDQIILEVWSSGWNDGSTNTVNAALCYNGLGQFNSYNFVTGSLTDTDATLKAPQAIVYQ